MGVIVEESNGAEFEERLGANDPALISRIISGEDRAVVAFYRWLYRRVFSHLKRKYGLSHDEAKEMTSDLVSHIYRHLWQYDPEKTALVAWIISIVNNKAVSEHRRRTSKTSERARRLFIYEMELREYLHRKYPNFEDEILRGLGLVEEEANPDVLLLEHVLFNSLGEGDRGILLQVVSLGFEKAASNFGIKNDTARKRFKRALDRLRKAYLEAKGSAAP
jgi:DNA-directed RNA polymerase specialized sigma24 family protein